MKKTLIFTLIISTISLATVFFWSQQTANNTVNQPTLPESVPATTTAEAVQEKVIEITAEKPVSFDGVEMVTYQSPYGFEITYPKEWVERLIPNETSPAATEYYIYPEEIPYGPSPLFQISLYELSLEEFMKDQVDQDLQPIIVNGQKGYLQFVGSNDIEDYRYIFLTENGLYSVIVIDSKNYNVTDEEVLWILSTFKITD